MSNPIQLSTCNQLKTIAIVRETTNGVGYGWVNVSTDSVIGSFSPKFVIWNDSRKMLINRMYQKSKEIMK